MTFSPGTNVGAYRDSHVKRAMINTVWEPRYPGTRTIRFATFACVFRASDGDVVVLGKIPKGIPDRPRMRVNKLRHPFRQSAEIE